MRTVILALLLAATLLVAPVALADGDDGRSHSDAGRLKAAEASDDHHATDDDNETDDEDDDAGERHGSRHDNASFRENRTALMERFVEQVHALRASWLENATKIREGCHASELDHRNETKENRTAAAHCVRDGYRDWRAAHAADIKEIREALRALLESRRGEHA